VSTPLIRDDDPLKRRTYAITAHYDGTLQAYIKFNNPMQPLHDAAFPGITGAMYDEEGDLVACTSSENVGSATRSLNDHTCLIVTMIPNLNPPASPDARLTLLQPCGDICDAEGYPVHPFNIHASDVGEPVTP